MRAARNASCLVAAVAIAGCASIPKFPATGELHGERVATTVDSEIARRYLHGVPDPLIEAAEHRYGGRVPTREELTDLAAATSIDFAAIFFARQVFADPCNFQMARAFERHLAAGLSPIAEAGRYVVLFVPGWDYVDNGPVTGADFARPRALATRLGLRNRLVAIGARETVEDNARVLAAEISRHAREEERVLLASASTGGPVTLLALAELVPPGERRSIAGWINIGGILRGSPLVEHLASGPRLPFFEFGLAWTCAALPAGELSGHPRVGGDPAWIPDGACPRAP